MANSPYLITGDITVYNEQTLTVEPGTEIIFNGDHQLNVEGDLILNGTVQDSIYISEWTEVELDTIKLKTIQLLMLNTAMKQRIIMKTFQAIMKNNCG